MKKVLIVEDDKYLGKMYKRAFSLNGHDVELITDGEEALRRLGDYGNKPDLVILDIIVPKVSGLDILRKIKDDSNIKDIPVAVLTNSLKKENEELMTSLGADLFLIKIEHDAKSIVEKANKLLNIK